MTPGESTEPSRPLEGLQVVDCATMFAGPMIATLMGDFGADVLKVEHPRGDDARRMGWTADGVSLWWALISRNKRCATLKLSDPDGSELLKRLLCDVDVLIENFRPGTLERWGLGPELLHEINPSLVIVRTTGFGQSGPYSHMPGFGTLAESISGFAYINGWPDKPPALPSFALGDAVAALAGCAAAMFALWWRDHDPSGRGQVVDVSLFEPLFWILGPQALVYDQLGVVQERGGNRLPFGAPRGAYRTKDGHWLGLSASAQSVSERVMRIIGRPDLIDQPWFADHDGRLQHADELDGLIQDWIGERTRADVLEVFSEAEAAIAPVYSIADIVTDEQYLAREALTRVPHPKLGSVLMQNLIARLTETPGQVRHAGPELGEHNVEIFADRLGLDAEALRRLSERGVI